MRIEIGEIEFLQIQFRARLRAEMAAIAIDLRRLPEELAVEFRNVGGRRGFFGGNGRTRQENGARKQGAQDA